MPDAHRVLFNDLEKMAISAGAKDIGVRGHGSMLRRRPIVPLASKGALELLNDHFDGDATAILESGH